MKNMIDWEYWNIIKTDPLFLAVQSNNMFDIETHINCVKDIEEFKNQLPRCFWIEEKLIKDTRGTRFMLIGEYYRDQSD